MSLYGKTSKGDSSHEQAIRALKKAKALERKKLKEGYRWVTISYRPLTKVLRKVDES